MILFTHGQESYLVRQKVEQIFGKALTQGVPETGINRIDATEATPQEIRTAMQSQGLFSDRQIVVIRDLLQTKSADDAEQAITNLDQVPKEIIVVFAEYGKPDKRRSAFKQISKAAERTWEFAAMDESAARRWANDYVKQQGIKIQPSALGKLITEAGTDAWRLSTELDKLSLAAEPITEQTVAELVTPEIAGDIFALVDALGNRNAEAAMRSWKALLESGEPPLRIMAMVVRQYRILLAIQSLSTQGHSDTAIASEIRGAVGNLPPFVIRKTRNQTKLFTEQELRDNFERLADLDFAVKTGRRDPETALELFIVESCQVAA